MFYELIVFGLFTMLGDFGLMLYDEFILENLIDVSET